MDKEINKEPVLQIFSELVVMRVSSLRLCSSFPALVTRGPGSAAVETLSLEQLPTQCEYKQTTYEMEPHLMLLLRRNEFVMELISGQGGQDAEHCRAVQCNAVIGSHDSFHPVHFSCFVPTLARNESNYNEQQGRCP